VARRTAWVAFPLLIWAGSGAVAGPLLAIYPNWLFWLWFAPLPYFTAWFAIVAGSWRTGLREAGRLSLVHLVILVVAFVASGIALFLFFLPIAIIAAGVLGDELGRRHARLDRDGASRSWRLVHRLGAIAGVAILLGIILAPLGWDAELRTTGSPVAVGIGLMLVTAACFVPHALASWFWWRRTHPQSSTPEFAQ
jgi:hypothetical protein